MQIKISKCSEKSYTKWPNRSIHCLVCLLTDSHCPSTILLSQAVVIRITGTPVICDGWQMKKLERRKSGNWSHSITRASTANARKTIVLAMNLSSYTLNLDAKISTSGVPYPWQSFSNTSGWRAHSPKVRCWVLRKIHLTIFHVWNVDSRRSGNMKFRPRQDESNFLLNHPTFLTSLTGKPFRCTNLCRRPRQIAINSKMLMGKNLFCSDQVERMPGTHTQPIRPSKKEGELIFPILKSLRMSTSPESHPGVQLHWGLQPLCPFVPMCYGHSLRGQ